MSAACASPPEGPEASAHAADDGEWVIVVRGVAEDAAAATDLEVRVAPGRSDDPEVLGETTRRAGELTFAARFGLEPGATYHVALSSTDAEPWLVTVPAPPPVAQARVVAVHPTSDELPENLLKFYVRFSRPMRPGFAYEHVSLVRGDGAVVPAPFLEIGEELWNVERTRLTLLLDPARVKRELVPHRELGRALLAGQDYVLRIDAGWPDDRGRPLPEPHEKRFTATPEDRRCPDPGSWTVTPPAPGTLEPLVVRFGEPLDHALAGRLIDVEDASARLLDGDVAIDGGERVWRFTPHAAWASGDHRLVIGTHLEDRVGNTIARPFEVDEFRRVNVPVKRAAVYRAFTVR